MSIFLAENTATGSWCCQDGYDTETGLCLNATKGSHEPFVIPAGRVQFDRVLGDTYYPPAFGKSASVSSSGSAPATSTVFVTTTASPKAASSSGTQAAIGAGVGVPLLIALLVALGFLWHQWRQRRKLQKELQFARSRPTEYSHSQMQPPMNQQSYHQTPFSPTSPIQYRPSSKNYSERTDTKSARPELDARNEVVEAGGRDPAELETRGGQGNN